MISTAKEGKKIIASGTVFICLIVQGLFYLIDFDGVICSLTSAFATLSFAKNRITAGSFWQSIVAKCAVWTAASFTVSPLRTGKPKCGWPAVRWSGLGGFGKGLWDTTPEGFRAALTLILRAGQDGCAFDFLEKVT